LGFWGVCWTRELSAVTEKVGHKEEEKKKKVGGEKKNPDESGQLKTQGWETNT